MTSSQNASPTPSKRGSRLAVVCFIVAALTAMVLGVVFLQRDAMLVALAALATLFFLLTWKLTRRRALWFNLGFLFLLLAGTQAWFSGIFAPAPPPAAVQQGDVVRYEGSYVGPFYFHKHPLFGKGPKEGAHNATKLVNDEIIYETVYTINRFGLRDSGGNGTGDVVLFFGDSIMFGEGVRDHEALPAQFVAQSGGKYDAINFGFHGYGPQQMAVAVESFFVDYALQGRTPVHAVYNCLPDHVLRVKGVQEHTWDYPKYVLGPDGFAHFEGYFTKPKPQKQPEDAFLMRVLRKLHLAQFLFKPEAAGRFEITDADVELLARVMEATAYRLKEAYGADFTVLLWNDKGRLGEGADVGLYNRIKTRLEEGGIRVIEVEEQILRPTGTPLPEFHIPKDGHPTAAAYAAMARYLLQNASVFYGAVNAAI